MIEWWTVDETVVELAKELIEKYHKPLKNARIGLLFRDEAPISNGKATLGRASKISDKWKPLLKDRYHFMIWLAYDRWQMLDNRSRRALLDHELCHCIMESDGKISIRPHDIEEFNDVIQRHGLWNVDAQQMALAVQGKLFESDGTGFVEAIVFPEVKRGMEELFNDVEVSFSRES